MLYCKIYCKKGSVNIKRTVPVITFSVFFINLVLFIVKLYVGLSSNSISIYSDGVNNLFDSLSGALSFFMLVSLSKNESPVNAFIIRKREHLLTFIISVAVSLSAFIFAYNSLERLTYPTPVSYLVKYLIIISITAAVKLLMAVFLRLMWKKTGSPVIKLIAVDSLLDFFITLVTVITLLTAKNGNFAIDAVCGIIISIIILIHAVKLVFSSVRYLSSTPGKEKRDIIDEVLTDEQVIGMSFDLNEDKSEVYIKTVNSEREKLNALSLEIEKRTDIKVNFIICEE